MCFSATASFVTAMGLAPVGVATLAIARRLDPKRWQPLALMPLLFATQQALEGFVWLALESPGPAPILPVVSLAYLGFAFALWPVWIPLSALRLATGHLAAWQRLLFRTLWGLGALLSAGLWIPLLFNPNLINPIVRRGSIDYQVSAFLPNLGGRHLAVTLIYALIICLPLLLHPYLRLRWLGVALAVAFAVTQVAFLHAFSSVWCYFSALISILLIWILQGAPAPAAWQ
jgi:hypothetical protein